MSSDPFPLDRELARLLGNDRVPELSAGFADRVVAATQGRAAPLPQARRISGWRRIGRRLVVGVVAAGALGSAAAATGLLDNLPIDIPTPREMWTSITGDKADPTPSSPARTATADIVPQTSGPVEIEGAIDTPEELEEAFRRIDQVRAGRRDTWRETVDRRIDNTIDRRRAQGLPAPTPEEEALLRSRIEQARDRRDERLDAATAERREILREEIENGGELTRETLIRLQRGVRPGTPTADRLERLRQLPPDQRRALIRQWRERQQGRLDQDRADPAMQTKPETMPGGPEDASDLSDPGRP